MRALSLDLRPSEKILRDFGYVALAVFAGLAACAWTESLMFRGGLGSWRAGLTVALVAVGALCASASLLRPTLNRPLFVALSVATYPVGLVVSYVALATLFLLVITPVALLFRLLGRDELRRRPVPGAESYWVASPSSRPHQEYFSQF